VCFLVHPLREEKEEKLNIYKKKKIQGNQIPVVQLKFSVKVIKKKHFKFLDMNCKIMDMLRNDFLYKEI
jgi:hypothetical protein